MMNKLKLRLYLKRVFENSFEKWFLRTDLFCKTEVSLEPTIFLIYF